jgi:hypothetical protein
MEHRPEIETVQNAWELLKACRNYFPKTPGTSQDVPAGTSQNTRGTSENTPELRKTSRNFLNTWGTSHKYLELFQNARGTRKWVAEEYM